MEMGVLNHSIGSASPGRGNRSIGPASPGRGPKCRIKCNGSRIQVGNREFISATEALQAYLDQYAGITINRQKYDRSVEDLLNPKSVLHMTADRSLQTGVRDTVKEMKLKETKDAITDSYDRMKTSDTLREQGQDSNGNVEDALNRSGELLQRIVKDDDSVSPSDVGTLNTDILLSLNPVAGYNETSQERKHIYSYRTSRTRSKTIGSVPLNRDKLDFTQDSLADNKPPISSFRSRFRPPGSLIRERSRSEPPSALRHGEPLGNSTHRSLLQDLDIDISKPKAPSWVEALDVANPVDSFWTKRDLLEGRPPPSWIQDMDKSDVSSMISSIGPKSDLNVNDLISYGNPSLQNHSIINTSAQGLSYRDLVTGTPLKSKAAADLLGREKQNLDKYDLTSKLPKEVKQSGNLDLSSSDALDRYLDELGCKKLDTVEVPRCSSLDTEALIAGMCAPAGSDITGASPILKENTPVKSSPVRLRRPDTPDTDLILDGDRPWEKPAVTFKSPVFMEDPPSKIHSPNLPITEESPTLTGRQQPGSLEALKNMIFKLQCEASGGSSQGQKEKIEQILSKGGDFRAAQLEEEIPALKGYNYMDEPGGQSLEKALIHLSKLKSLVQTNQQTDGTKKQPGSIT